MLKDLRINQSLTYKKCVHINFLNYEFVIGLNFKVSEMTLIKFGIFIFSFKLLVFVEICFGEKSLI